jgi:hypothetical protein
MADVILSPNMSLPVPTVGVDAGPDWATNINGSLGILDQHNHSSGSGVQIQPNGIDISSDLPFNSNNATQLRSSRYVNNTGSLTDLTDINEVYVVNGNLWFNNVSGTPVQVTSGNSIIGTAGSISGLPSGTASASYAGGTFTWQSATNTPAAMAVGPLIIGQEVINSYTVTLQPSTGQSSNINIQFPPALPSGLNYMTLDASGNIAYNTNGTVGTGGVVLATGTTGGGSAVLAVGASISSATITSSTFSGTNTNSGTISGGTYSSPTLTNATLGGSVTNINSGLSINGNTNLSTLPINSILTTDGSLNLRTRSSYGSGPMMSADIIGSISVTVSGGYGLSGAIPIANANKYIWIANILNCGATGGGIGIDIVGTGAINIFVSTDGANGTFTLNYFGFRYLP